MRIALAAVVGFVVGTYAGVMLSLWAEETYVESRRLQDHGWD